MSKLHYVLVLTVLSVFAASGRAQVTEPVEGARNLPLPGMTPPLAGLPVETLPKVPAVVPPGAPSAQLPPGGSVGPVGPDGLPLQFQPVDQLIPFSGIRVAEALPAGHPMAPDWNLPAAAHSYPDAVSLTARDLSPIPPLPPEVLHAAGYALPARMPSAREVINGVVPMPAPPLGQEARLIPPEVAPGLTVPAALMSTVPMPPPPPPLALAR